MLADAIRLFEDANKIFLTRDIETIRNRVSERCLCGSLKTAIERTLPTSLFHGYIADIEYNRNDAHIKTILNSDLVIVNVTCDLVLHSRGTIPQQDNILAIEMKYRDGDLESKEKDRERLRCLTKRSFNDVWVADGTTLPQHVCGYVLGVFYQVDHDKGTADLEYYASANLLRTSQLKLW